MQEALEAKKATEEATHRYVAKQRQYDTIAQEMKVGKPLQAALGMLLPDASHYMLCPVLLPFAC